MEIALDAKNISKTFMPEVPLRQLLSSAFRTSHRVLALKDASFSVPKGQVAGVLGPNGAGKTTLLKIIATILLPDRGRVTVNGRYSVGADDEKIKSIVGLACGPDRGFYHRLTGRQNLEFFAALYGLKNHQARKAVDRLLDLFRVDYADRQFHALSAGMKQTFGLMRSLVHDPEILLLDEPTKSLDYASAKTLKILIRDKLCREQGKTIVLTTHQMEDAEGLCDLFILLDKGAVRACGALEELRRKTGAPRASLGDIYLKLCSPNS